MLVSCLYDPGTGLSSFQIWEMTYSEGKLNKQWRLADK
jgi:hypothetical protein